MKINHRDRPSCIEDNWNDEKKTLRDYHISELSNDIDEIWYWYYTGWYSGTGWLLAKRIAQQM